jgi:hypothetical protein
MATRWLLALPRFVLRASTRPRQIRFACVSVTAGWTRAPAVGQEGYDLKNDAGEVLFGYRIAGNVCRVVTNVYDDKGELAASASEGGLIVHKGPAHILPL